MFTKSLAIACISLVCLASCTVVSIPLVQPTRPLNEKTLEGEGRSKVLLIDLSGLIADEPQNSVAGLGSEPDMVSRIKEELDMAGKDSRIKALLLRINSPGGTVTASDIIYREIITFKEKQKIPVVACLMDVAASGGYYIASAADRIVAHPTSITGSIGVIAMKFNLKGLMDKVGIEEESIKSGEKKDILSPFRGMTAEERRIMQEIISDLHRKFVEVVDQGRPDLSREQIEPLADGRVFTSGQALAHKLIDQVGYLDDAISAAKAQAGLKDARVVTYRRPEAYKNNIYSQATINLFNIGSHDFQAFLPVRFMYLWNP